MKSDEETDSLGIIMRSSRYFFILNMDREENIICRTIKFSHRRRNILFGLSEESDGMVRVWVLLEVLLSGEGKTYYNVETERSVSTFDSICAGAYIFMIQ
ncbi:MAG: hypothetical protein HFI01_06875 [Lachnospiraceae bacterium]|jgi:hypothetical protein|nr:hypothetical protein [Lachnospiraceae bacterium]